MNLAMARMKSTNPAPLKPHDAPMRAMPAVVSLAAGGAHTGHPCTTGTPGAAGATDGGGRAAMAGEEAPGDGGGEARLQ